MASEEVREESDGAEAVEEGDAEDDNRRVEVRPRAEKTRKVVVACPEENDGGDDVHRIEEFVREATDGTEAEGAQPKQRRQGGLRVIEPSQSGIEHERGAMRDEPRRTSRTPSWCAR